MRIIDCNTIEVNRGDELLFDYQILNGKTPYTFVDGDIVGFYVYKAKQLTKDPVIAKTFEPTPETDVVEIHIEATEMEIGSVQNIQEEYWYEITLNGEITLGYDDRGPKLLIVYPKGKK